MKKRMLTLALVGAFTVVATAAIAKPVKLSKAELGRVVAGAITATKTNGGGNTPNGSANGVPTVNKNPAGKAPAGQN